MNDLQNKVISYFSLIKNSRKTLISLEIDKDPISLKINDQNLSKYLSENKKKLDSLQQEDINVIFYLLHSHGKSIGKEILKDIYNADNRVSDGRSRINNIFKLLFNEPNIECLKTVNSKKLKGNTIYGYSYLNLEELKNINHIITVDPSELKNILEAIKLLCELSSVKEDAFELKVIELQNMILENIEAELENINHITEQIKKIRNGRLKIINNEKLKKLVDDFLNSKDQLNKDKESNLVPSLLKNNLTKVLLFCASLDLELNIIETLKTIALDYGISIVSNEYEIKSSQKDFMKNYDAFIVINSDNLLIEDSNCSHLINNIHEIERVNKPVLVLKEINSLTPLEFSFPTVSFNELNTENVFSQASKFFQNIKTENIQSGLFALAKSNEKEYIKTYADIYDVRLYINIAAKKKIAEVVFNKFIKDVEAPILLDAGTVTYYVAEYAIKKNKNIKMYTNNLYISKKLNTIYNSDIHIIPGKVNNDFEATTGPAAAKYTSEIFANKVEKPLLTVLGLRAFDHTKGFSEDIETSNEFQSILFKESEKLVIVAQGEKLIKPVKQASMVYDDYLSILMKRTKEKNIWFVIHEPTLAYLSHELIQIYKNNLSKIQELLPSGHVILIENVESESNRDKIIPVKI